MLAVDDQGIRLRFVIEDDPPFKLLPGVPIIPIEGDRARVDKPAELARILLDDPVTWSAEALEAALDSGRTRTLGVARDVTVLLHYTTAGLDESGQLQLRNDIYDHDHGILAALAARRTALPR